MIIDPKSELFGFPALTTRAYFRDLVGCYHLDAQFVAARCDITKRRAQKFLDDLREAAYSETSARGHTQLTDAAYRIVNASARPMTRKTAQKKLDALRQRIEKFDEQGFMHHLVCVVLYGSFINDPGKPKVGDLDVGFAIVSKFHSGSRKYDEASEERRRIAEMNGHTFRSFFEIIAWPEMEVTRYLKARTPGLSLTPINNLKTLDICTCEKHRVLLGDLDALRTGLTPESNKEAAI